MATDERPNRVLDVVHYSCIDQHPLCSGPVAPEAFVAERGVAAAAG